MVFYRINETLQTGAVTNRTYRAGEAVYLFLKFTIKPPSRVLEKRGERRYTLWYFIELMRHSKPVRLQTAPTGRVKLFVYF